MLRPAHSPRTSQVTSNTGTKSPEVEFIQGDALGANVSRAGILCLADASWPETLAARVWNKIADEGRKDAVMVSNTLPTNATTRARFKLLGVVKLPVSWQTDQPFYVMTLAPGHSFAKWEFPRDDGAIKRQTKPRTDHANTWQALEGLMGLAWERAGVVRWALELEAGRWKRPIPTRAVLRQQSVKLRSTLRRLVSQAAAAGLRT